MNEVEALRARVAELQSAIRTYEKVMMERGPDDSPEPIATAPTDDPERVLLLYCPEEGGWHTGVYFEGLWRAHASLGIILGPTHWLPGPAEPVDAQ